MDAIESIEAADMRKVFRFEFLGEPDAMDAICITIIDIIIHNYTAYTC
jgi:hypothetical protein